MYRSLLVIFFVVITYFAHAQQQVAIIGRCGGIDTVTIPTIIDNDHDGMDDRLEQKLLNYFMPTIIQFSDESCPGPALDGTGDSNLVACHIYPYPAQYTASNNVSLVLTNPVALVPAHGLTAGLVWYNPLIMVNTAVLYGQDCGLLGHTADVEGFSFSLVYIGTDSLAGWMYDTIMTNWRGGTIQTISHAGTLCEQIETYPYLSQVNPNGKNTVYASPDKHGNYLTISGCGSSIICNPGCGNAQSVKVVRPINLGEPNYSLIADLGSIYPAYVGNDPWSTVNFLNAQGGNAGAIRDKMIKALTTDFITGQTLTAAQICPLYSRCFGPAISWLPNVSSCGGGPYSFYGRPITSTGMYYQTFTDSYGCDSIIALNYSLHSPSSYSYNDVACNTNQYLFNGQLLQQPGVYTDTILNSYGCDSIITLSLSFDSLPAVSWQTANDTVLIDAMPLVLSGGNPPGGIYSGDGVNGNMFYPDFAGAGSHLITYTFSDSLCSNSASKTIVVQSVSGISDIEQQSSLLLFPNPTNGLWQMIYSKNDVPVSVAIYNTKGSLVKHINLQNSSTSIDVSDISKGFYVAAFVLKSGLVYKRLVIE